MNSNRTNSSKCLKIMLHEPKIRAFISGLRVALLKPGRILTLGPWNARKKIGFKITVNSPLQNTGNYKKKDRQIAMCCVPTRSFWLSDSHVSFEASEASWLNAIPTRTTYRTTLHWSREPWDPKGSQVGSKWGKLGSKPLKLGWNMEPPSAKYQPTESTSSCMT